MNRTAAMTDAMWSLCLGLVLCLLFAPPLRAAEGMAEGPHHDAVRTCDALAAAAETTGLSVDFLARAVWEGAEDTDVEAIAATATALAALQEDYGNPGLAALAHFAGTEQIETFMGGGGIPPASVDFIILTTGHIPEIWRDLPADLAGRAEIPPLAVDVAFHPACVEWIAGRWGEPLPDLVPLPPRSAPMILDPSERSLRPRLRPIPKLAKWGAQLAFGTSRDRAETNFTRATRACRNVVGDAPDFVHVENRVRGREGYWMARVSRMDRDESEEICRKARARGCSCVVYKNY